MKPMIAGLMGIMMVMIAAHFLQAAPVPACTPGQTKCVGYDLYLCDDDCNWVLLKHNAAECGYVPVGVYGCPYCDESFDTLQELIAHVAAAHPDKPPIQEVDIIWD